jgi:hypothetical protein
MRRIALKVMTLIIKIIRFGMELSLPYTVKLSDVPGGEWHRAILMLIAVNDRNVRL